ncbi:MAG: hypothetical protein JWQ90_4615 [Hydrocarboniphaga sp.]|uniref:hypothetical protein n=1 Tax=Hydrocarboniphaga sp. TaxID=2033016 RepID=UPI0026339549|nr:hypothetical protein [Hydrocarboniphaga sp.]MDB5972165.1 hypothetical protein [Hydrocarboniphaga sp.]
MTEQAPKVILSSFGVPVLDQPVPVSPLTLHLVSAGIAALWSRIVAANPMADSRPLLLSYDVHPMPDGPVLIEVNTNAGGVLTAMQAARNGNECCADWEHGQLEARLLALFRRDLLGLDRDRTGIVAIVDDSLAAQPLLAEMRALADLMRPFAAEVLVLDAADLNYHDGRLRHGETAIDRVYWRSTDFLLTEPGHASVRRAVLEKSTILAPSPEAYEAIADKRRLVEWSVQPELATDAITGLSFRIAETLPMNTRTVEAWYADRSEWVFKPVSGYASRGVYIGKSISRRKLAELPADDYLAQRYAPHPVIDRDGRQWKYDVRFFADRGQVIGAAARVFQGQVVGMREPGSGFAPLRVEAACCLIGALAAAMKPAYEVKRPLI